MTIRERVLPPSMRYLSNAYALTTFRDSSAAVSAWKIIAAAARHHFGSDGIFVLQEIAENGAQKNQNILKPNLFKDFVVLVGEQGSGKATMAKEFARRGYAELTMSDVVRAVAPDFGYSPDTTQGKIDTGHAIRRIFGRSILMKLCVVDALKQQKKNIVIDGPRSMYEIRAARAAGARIIGLIADPDRKLDRKIRFERVVSLRPMTQPERRVAPDDFYSRDRQEGSRSRRMLAVADMVVVTNRPPRDLVDKLITK